MKIELNIPYKKGETIYFADNLCRAVALTIENIEVEEATIYFSEGCGNPEGEFQIEGKKGRRIIFAEQGSISGHWDCVIRGTAKMYWGLSGDITYEQYYIRNCEIYHLYDSWEECLIDIKAFVSGPEGPQGAKE